jgi:hypothetical protein
MKRRSIFRSMTYRQFVEGALSCACDSESTCNFELIARSNPIVWNSFSICSQEFNGQCLCLAVGELPDVPPCSLREVQYCSSQRKQASIRDCHTNSPVVRLFPDPHHIT